MNITPNYFVIGAAKAASSTICTFLGQHPDVFMIDCKEPCFFSDDRNYLERGWKWYESLYVGSENCLRRGEGSNQYSMKELWPHTAQRIHSAVPDAKLIYIVRHPLRRIESLWMQLIANGDRNLHPDFNRAILERPDILVDSTNYLRQLEPYCERFETEQIRVVFYEDFMNDASEVTRVLFSFLEVPKWTPATATAMVLNRSEGKLAYSSLLMHIRRARWLKPFKSLLSDRFKQRTADRFFRRLLSSRPIWTPHSRKLTLERLRDDSRTLCLNYGKPADFWDLGE